MQKTIIIRPKLGALLYAKTKIDPNGALFIQNKLYICMQLVEQKTLNMMSQKRLTLRLLYRDATKTISHTQKWGICI